MVFDNKIKELIEENKNHECGGGVCVKIEAVAKLPTSFGNFSVVAFSNNSDKKEHTALIKGDVVGKTNVLVRLHSECLTGDGFESLRCDCREQLSAALEKIEGEGTGVVLYLRQEGRGIGLINKIKAYALQDEGLDTFEANKVLGFSSDERDYDIAAHMLASLKIKSIKLLTNNPEKIADLKKHGVKVQSRIPLIIKPNKYNKFYLETKKIKGHLFEQEEEVIVKK